jgi:hypothetical protein
MPGIQPLPVAPFHQLPMLPLGELESSFGHRLVKERRLRSKVEAERLPMLHREAAPRISLISFEKGNQWQGSSSNIFELTLDSRRFQSVKVGLILYLRELRAR